MWASEQLVAAEFPVMTHEYKVISGNRVYYIYFLPTNEGTRGL